MGCHFFLYIVLGLTFKSLIHPELIITYNFCKSPISFSTCEYLISLLLFIQETILTLLHILDSLTKISWPTSSRDLLLLFSCSVTQSCLTLCDPMDYRTPRFPVLYHLPELAQTHVHWQVNGAIQPSHPLSSPSLSAFNLSHHQDLLQWVICLHHVVKVLELQFQHQSLQWIFKGDIL